MIRVTFITLVVLAAVLLVASPAFAAKEPNQKKINTVFDVAVAGAVFMFVIAISLGLLAFHFLFMTAFPRYSHRVSVAAARTPFRALILGFVNILFLVLCYVGTEKRVPFLGGLFAIAFILMIMIGLMGQSRNLGRSILRRSGSESGDIGAVALGFFVIAFINVIPVFGWLFTLYNIASGSGAVVLALARRDALPAVD
ncbi:MAG: hypothetical protein ACYS8W_02415 [Planctomycetota bacterium]|jgi:uncharacterized membrane protein YGL010W